MKKLFILCLILILLLSSACTKTNDTTETGKNQTSEPTIQNNNSSEVTSVLTLDESDKKDKEKKTEILKKLDNEKTLSPPEHDINTVRQWYSYHLPMGVSSVRGAIQDIDEKLAVENLRQTDEEHFYTVYKIKDGGLLYLFFKGKLEADYSNTFLRIRATMYAEKPLVKNEFNSIAVGDSIDKVIAVDPTARFCEEEYKEDPEEIIHISKHLLSDGAMSIKYKRENGNLTVEKINYSKDYELSFNEEIYNYKILPQDYIKD